MQEAVGVAMATVTLEAVFGRTRLVAAPVIGPLWRMKPSLSGRSLKPSGGSPVMSEIPLVLAMRSTNAEA